MLWQLWQRNPPYPPPPPSKNSATHVILFPYDIFFTVAQQAGAEQEEAEEGAQWGVAVEIAGPPLDLIYTQIYIFIYVYVYIWLYLCEYLHMYISASIYLTFLLYLLP